MSSYQEITSIQLDEQALTKFGFENDPTMRVRGFFPFSVATGNTNTAVVYFELEPGHWLGTHTDSSEEVMLILSGTAELTVGEMRSRVTGGTMAIVPAMAPHAVHNVGDDVVRVVGFFPSNTVMSTFDQPLVPIGPALALPESQRTMVTPPPALLEQPVLAMATALD